MKFGIREVCDCVFTSTDGKGLNFISNKIIVASLFM